MAGASLFFRLFDSYETPTPDSVTPDERIVDAGAYRYVAFSTRILAGATAYMYIEHAAVKDQDAWASLATIFLGNNTQATGPLVNTSEDFLRYLRLRFDNSADLSFVKVAVDGVAKP